MNDVTVEIELVDQITATVAPIDTTVVTVPAAQGLPGVPGRDGGSTFDLIAGEAIGGDRLLTTDASGNAIYADSGTLAHANAVIGLSLGAASIGASVSVQSAGEIDEPSWTWTPGETLWLGTNGMIATTPPATGFSLVIGYAIAATKIFLNIGTPIIL